MTKEILREQLREVMAAESELLQKVTKGGECYEESAAETAANSQGQAATEAEGALHLPATQ